MISRIRKNCKRLKSSIKKNKYKGGLTSKSGVYGFFVNKSQWDKLFGAIVKDADAPSISKIEDSLRYQGYFFKKGDSFIDVIGAEKSPISKDFQGYTFQSDCRGIIEYVWVDCNPGRKGHCDDNSRMKNETNKYTIKDLECHAAFFSELMQPHILKYEEKFNDTVHDILGLMQYHDVFNTKLNINCCVFIDVSKIAKNTYKGFIDYDDNRNEERKKSLLIKIGKDPTTEKEWFCIDTNHKIHDYLFDSDKYRKICPSRFPKKTD
jgi:hypothetical protein